MNKIVHIIKCTAQCTVPGKCSRKVLYGNMQKNGYHNHRDFDKSHQQTSGPVCPTRTISPQEHLSVPTAMPLLLSALPPRAPTNADSSRLPLSEIGPQLPEATSDAVQGSCSGRLSAPPQALGVSALPSQDILPLSSPCPSLRHQLGASSCDHLIFSSPIHYQTLLDSLYNIYFHCKTGEIIGNFRSTLM